MRRIIFILFLSALTGIAIASDRIINSEQRDEIICCDNKWFADDRSIDGCCDGKAFRYNESICCNNRLIPHEEMSQFYECCGDAAYNTNNQTCCDGKTVLGPFQKIGCCGTQGFDQTTHICCGSVDREYVLFDNKGSCCGTKSYDESTQFCCGGIIVDVPAGGDRFKLECCGNSLIEKEKQICCKDVAHDIVPDTSMQCCYDDGKIYDPRKDMCCNGITHENVRAEDGYECCNKQIFLPKTHACCYDSGAPLERPAGSTLEDTLICCNGTRLYINAKQICCNGEVKDKIGERSSCCGSEVFDLEKASCCDGRLITEPDHFACCAKEAWNTKTHACCNDTLVSYGEIPTLECSKYCLRRPVVKVFHFRG